MCCVCMWSVHVHICVCKHSHMCSCLCRAQTEVEFLSWDVCYFYFLRLYLTEPVGFGWVSWIMNFKYLLVSCPSSLQGGGSRHISCVFWESKLRVSCLWRLTQLPRFNIGSLKRRDIRKYKRQVIKLLS